jgi:hypothetical protein
MYISAAQQLETQYKTQHKTQNTERSMQHRKKVTSADAPAELILLEFALRWRILQPYGPVE